MKRSPPIFHVLRVILPSALQDWQVLLPKVTLVVLAYGGVAYWKEVTDQGWKRMEIVDYIVGLSFLILAICAATLTRSSLSRASNRLPALPMRRSTRLSIFLLEHFTLYLIWALAPVIVLVVWLGQLDDRIEGLLFISLGGNSIFALAVFLSEVFSPYSRTRRSLLRWILILVGLPSAILLVSLRTTSGGNFLPFIPRAQLPLPVESIDIFLAKCFAISCLLAVAASVIPVFRQRPVRKPTTPATEALSLLTRDFFSRSDSGMYPWWGFVEIAVRTFLHLLMAIASIVALEGYSKLFRYLPFLFGLPQLLHESPIRELLNTLEAVLEGVCITACVVFTIRAVNDSRSFVRLLLDCQERPIKTGSIIGVSFLQLLVTYLGIFWILEVTTGTTAITLGGFAFWLLFGTSLLVWVYAYLPSLRFGGDLTRHMGWSGGAVLLGVVAGLVAVYWVGILFGSRLMLPDHFVMVRLEIGLCLLLIYNLWAMHWMWKRS